MTYTLQIPEEMTIYQVVTLHQTLLAALLSHEALCLDLSRIGEMDTAGMQLLLWAQREGERLNKPVTLTHPSESVDRLACMLGLSTDLRLTRGSA